MTDAPAEPVYTLDAVGRGTAYNIVARAAFLISSYAIHIVLAYLLAPNDYGNFGVVLGLITIARVFFSAGLPQTVSKLIAHDETNARAIWWLGSKLQIAGAAVVTLLYVAGIPLWTRLLQDESLASLLVVAAPMIPLMAWYQINLAYLNGRLWFGLQSLATIVYSVLRVLLAVLLVVLGFGVSGALAGLALALLAVALVSYSQVPEGPTTTSRCAAELISFSWPLMIYAVAVAALLNLDLLMLKRYFPDAALIGYYSAAANLGKTPYFLFATFSITLLPAVAGGLASRGRAATAKVVALNLTRLVVVSTPFAAIVSVTSESLLAAVYKPEFTASSTPLSILVWSMFALSLLVALASCITGAGRPGATMMLVVGAMTAQVALGMWLIPPFGMMGAAVANALAVASGMVAASVLTKRLLGGLVEPVRVAKTLAASTVVGAAAWLLQTTSLVGLALLYAACAVLYFAVLAAICEQTRQELARGWATVDGLLRRVVPS